MTTDKMREELADVARRLAEKANECCHRSDGYEEDMQAAILAALLAASEAATRRALPEGFVPVLVEEYGILRYRLACMGERNHADLAERADARKREIRALLSASPAGVGGCTCEACAPRNSFGGRTMMSLCPECGDKRCPKARHHSNACPAAPAIAKQGE